MCIHMRYEGLKPAISVDSVKIFAVYYRHNTTDACHNLSTTTLHRAANKSTDVPAAPVPWLRLFTR
jgi:hypothetical protein